MKYGLLIACLGASQAIHESKPDPTLVHSAKTTASGNWLPDKYSTDDDDQLMRNLIERGTAYTKDKGFTDKYLFKTEKGCGCTEQSCLCCMQKHTHFWVDKAGALAAAQELVGTNLHLEGDKLTQYLNEKFPEVWNKYDVIKTGWIEVERMSMFYKELMNDWTISIQ